ncbi:MAG: hypothetical protein AAGM38_09715 [Pseudomonadota bacterium]
MAAKALDVDGGGRPLFLRRSTRVSLGGTGVNAVDRAAALTFS